MATLKTTFVELLKDCTKKRDLKKGIELHHDIQKTGMLERDPFLATILINMYVKCDLLTKAQDVHDSLPIQSIFSWNTLIAGYMQTGQNSKAIDCLEQMQSLGFCPDGVTFTCMLKVYTGIGALDRGEAIHKAIKSRGLLERDVVLGNCLVDMYAKFSLFAKARQVLLQLPNRDVVSWTSLLAGCAQHGHGHEALYCYRQMQTEGFSPSEVTFACILKIYQSTGDIDNGKRIHNEIISRGLTTKSVVLTNAIMDMYAKNGLLQNSQRLFDELPMRDTISWNAIIVGYSKLGKILEALQCFNRMQTECHHPDEITFSFILMACGISGDVGNGIRTHNELVVRGLLNVSALLGTSLVDMYVKCGMLGKARTVLDDLTIRDTVSWSAIITGYAEQGHSHEALNCFEQMQREGLSPDRVTFICILKACAEERDIEKGKQIHKEILDRNLLERDIVLGTCLVHMYAKCDMVSTAHQVHDSLSVRNVICWSTLIAGYARDGKDNEALNCFKGMRNDGIFPDQVTLFCILGICGDIGAIAKGKEIHCVIATSRLEEKDKLLGNALVDMYIKCGVLFEAQEMFDDLLVRNAVSWSMLTAGCVQQREYTKTLEYFRYLKIEGVSPTEIILSSVLKSCGSIGDINIGKDIHDRVIMEGLLEKDVELGNALVDMYAKCGMLAEAVEVLDGLPVRSVVSWNTIIAGCAEWGQAHEALHCFKTMMKEDISPNDVTFTCILKLCGCGRDIVTGRYIHNEIVIDAWMQENVILGNVVVDMYIKCGALAEARAVFEELYVRDIASWSSLVIGCVQQGQSDEALKYFERMLREGVSPNEFTLTCILEACTERGDINKGRQIHHEVIQRGLLEKSIVLGGALIEMYAAFSAFAEAHRALDGLPFRDLVSWNILITAYANEGKVTQVFNCLRWMQRDSLSPDKVSYISALKACSIAGATGKGKQIHNEIVNRGILEKDIVLGNALVNMYAKCGMLVKAQEVLDELPVHDVVTWGALIGGYAQQGNVHQALNCFIQMQREGIYPSDITFVSMLNACSHSGKSHNAQMIFEKMSTKYGITPILEHHTCMVVTFGSTGQFDNAMSIIKSMPSTDHASIWLAVLHACKKWSNMELARSAFDQTVQFDTNLAAAYVLMTCIYASVGMQKNAEFMKALIYVR